MSNVGFSAQTIRVPNPLVPFARASLATGVIVTVASGWCLARLQPAISDLFLSSQFGTARAGALILFGLACAVWLVRGIFMIADGVRLIGPLLIVPPRTPADLPDLESVENVLVRQEFPELRVKNHGLLGLVQAFLRERVLYGTWREFALLEQSLKSVRTALVLAAVVAVVLFVALPKVQAAVPAGVVGALTWIAVAIATSAALRGLAIPLLLSKTVPMAGRDEQTRMVRGGGDPATLQPMVEQEFLRLREAEVPNRVVREMNSSHGTVADTGKYTARMYVETQPVADAPDESPLTLLYLGGGTGCWVVGMLIAVLGLTGGSASSAMSGALTAFVWTWIGGGLLGSGRLHLSRFRYRSTLAFLKTEGTIGRSELKAGKGLNDSFESANLVVRSDSTMRLYAASIVSETYRVDGRRFIIAADRDQKSDQAMKSLNRTVDDYERAGIVVRPIEATDPGLNQMAQANLAYRQAASTLGGASPPTSLLGESGRATSAFQMSASASAQEATPSSETKDCPMCGEAVRAAARKCRFCGHMFEG